ncbi:MAG: hypothetical protein U0514_02825 [Candidatus Andersenbacteria bacterium]
MHLPKARTKQGMRRALAGGIAAVLGLGQLGLPALSRAQEPVAAEQVQADAATVTLKVGAGQQYGSLQEALDAIPGSVSVPYKVAVYPGTYLGGATLQGKSISGGSISIENATSTKPLFTGATVVGSGWTTTANPDVWAHAASGVTLVTDRNERLRRVASVAEPARSANAWFSDGVTVLVRLFDLTSPNSHAPALTSLDFGLRLVGCAGHRHGPTL